eukprot:Awhi_evm1s13002
MPIIIETINTRGLCGGTFRGPKQHLLEKKIENNDFTTILSLVETNKLCNLSDFLKKHIAVHSHDPAKNNGHGVAIMLSESIERRNPQILMEGYIVSIEVKLMKRWMTIIAVYASPNNNPGIGPTKTGILGILKNRVDRITAIKTSPLVLLGDFNTVMRKEDRTKENYRYDHGNISTIRDLLLHNHLIDVQLEKNLSNQQLFTYQSTKNNFSRLDYIFISKPLKKNTVRSTITKLDPTAIGLDHYIPSITLSDNKPREKANPLFRTNDFVLGNAELNELMKGMLNDMNAEKNLFDPKFDFGYNQNAEENEAIN